ncbi:MAG: peptidyl-prolyl cis-trans isomerase [Burkholderiales bacterium]|nr:peptidyl-prolyl cis-trans isomerase [Burkholderiales bacterium]
MMRAFAFVLALLFATGAGAADPQVEIRTSAGVIVVELFPDKTPLTVANFLQYVKAGHYDGTVFHRVIAGFMIQGGGYTADFKEKATRAPIRNEAEAGPRNTAGTIAMARTADPHSATAQFFINVADNRTLDFRYPTQEGYGYCVFGRVAKGMDVVKRIEKVATGDRPGGHRNVPLKPVVIESARLLDAVPKPGAAAQRAK